MQDLFSQQIAILEAACHKLLDRPDDPITQEIVLRALAAIRPNPEPSSSPLVVGLTNVVWHFSEVLRFRLEQAKNDQARSAQLKRAASEMCTHIAELKEAVEGHGKKKPASA